MRKWIALLLATAIVLSMCACGDSKTDDSVGETVEALEPSAMSIVEEDSIEVEAISAEPIAEDETISKELLCGVWYGQNYNGKLEIDGLTIKSTSIDGYGKIYNGWEIVGDKINFREEPVFTIVEDETGIRLLSSIDGDEYVQFSYFAESTGLVTSATKEDIQGEWFCEETGRYLTIEEYEIMAQGSNKAGGYSVDSYVLEDGVIDLSSFGRLYVYQGDNGFELEVISDRELAGIYTKPVEPEAVQLNLGEIFETDFAKFSVTGVTFVDRLNTETASAILTRDRGLTSGGLTPGNDQIFVCVSFDFENLAKQEIRIDDVVAEVAVDYNDGYIYDSRSGVRYCFDSFGWYNDYAGNGYVLSLTPLEKDSYRMFIACPVLLSEETGAPLTVKVTLTGENETELVEYVVR